MHKAALQLQRQESRWSGVLGPGLIHGLCRFMIYVGHMQALAIRLEPSNTDSIDKLSNAYRK